MKTRKNISNIVTGFVLTVVALTCTALLLAYLFGYWEKPRTTTEVSVIWDVTERHEPHPEAADILPLFGIDNTDRNGSIFRFTYASDVSLNRETVFSIAKAGDDVLTNQFDRKREAEQFTGKVSAFLDSLAKDTVGRGQSSLYIPIAEAVNRLAQDTSAQKKILLVYSDLRENRQGLSFYDRKTLALLKSDPQKIRDMLFALAPLGDLSGVEVHFLYEPANSADDSAYRTISSFYKNILENAGAKVIISANLAE